MKRSGGWIIWGVLASLWQLSFIFLHVSAHLPVWIFVLAVFHEVPLADIATIQSLLWNNMYMCLFVTFCMKTRFILKTPFSLATNIVSERWNEQPLLLPHLEVEERIEPREYAILLVDYSSVLPAGRLPQQCGSDACAGLDLGASVPEAAPKNSPDKGPVLLLFSLPLSRKYYTIHKKARTSEKRGSKAVTAKCSSVPLAVAAGPGSWRLLMRWFAATACTDIDLQVQFRCLSVHNA